MSDGQQRPLSNKEARTFFGYSEDDHISRLEDRLGELAMLWRGSKDEKHITEYRRVLSELLALDWTEYLDADAELPDELMPSEYFDRKK